MTRIEHASQKQLEACAEGLERVDSAMGFTPNSMKVMARNPKLLNGFLALSSPLMGPEALLEPGLRQMIAHITSAAAGCRYCQAHTAHGAERRGVSNEKIQALWQFESNPLFNDSERAALSLALAAGSVPNAATNQHFEELGKYFSDDEITEIVGLIAFFGFLNRWNDTLATTLEDSPLAFAESQLAATGWERGKHG